MTQGEEGREGVLTNPSLWPLSTCDDEHLPGGSCDGDGAADDTGRRTAFCRHGEQVGEVRCALAGLTLRGEFSFLALCRPDCAASSIPPFFFSDFFLCRSLCLLAVFPLSLFSFLVALCNLHLTRPSIRPHICHLHTFRSVHLTPLILRLRIEPPSTPSVQCSTPRFLSFFSSSLHASLSESCFVPFRPILHPFHLPFTYLTPFF